MVRTIDGEARRQLLADAVWRLLRNDGLEAASVRAVATESGLSPGSVRHFFTTQDELHVFAMQELGRRITARVKDVLVTEGSGTDAESSPAAARDRVRAALLQLLPTTERSTADFHAHLQFIVKAVVHEPLSQAARQGHRELEEFYVTCFDYLLEAGATEAHLDPHSAACELAVVMDGLALRRLTAPERLSDEQMIRILDAQLNVLAPEVVS